MEVISEDISGDEASFNIIRKNLLPELLDGDTSENPAENRVKVFLRLRPFTTAELSKNENQDCIKVESDTSLLIQNFQSHRHASNQQQRFTFSHIFNEDADQKCLFDKAVLPTLQEFIDGQNCLIFTYGVTNSGKTYTIHGDAKDSGLLPRSLDVVFNSISGSEYGASNLKPDSFCDITRLNVDQEQAERRIKQAVLFMSLNTASEDGSKTTSSIPSFASCSNISSDDEPDCKSAASDDEEDIATVVANRRHNFTAIDIKSQGNIRFAVWVSFGEIYNEQIFDLLMAIPSKKMARRPNLQLREDKHGRPYIKGLTEIQVSSADEAYRVLCVGRKNLHIACTKMNQSSSRSHCIFTVKLVRVVDKENPNVARVSMLSFCDLAGSERQNKTQGAGDRLKEAGNINSSLLTLGRCITILRRNQTIGLSQPQIVPFRESKLTRLFQSFFTGKGQVSMIVNISRCFSVFDETLFAIKYSAIAQQVVVSRVSQPLPLKVEEENVEATNDLPQTHHAANRETIGWASPGTYQKLIEDGHLSVSLAFSNDNNSRLSSMSHEKAEDDEDSLVDANELFEEERQQWENERKHLKDVIQKLKDKLIETHHGAQAAEVRIREEVCEEMKTQLVLIENNYQENLRVYSEIQEEKYTAKMAILKEALTNTRKRPRTDDVNGDVAGQQMALERVKEVEQKNKELEKEICKLRANFNTVCDERDQALQKSTELQFSLASLEKKQSSNAVQELEKVDIELLELKEYIKNANRERDEAVKQSTDLQVSVTELMEEIQSAKLELDLARKELSDLRASFDTASEERDQAIRQSTQLQQSLTSVQQHLNELRSASKAVDKIEAENIGLAVLFPAMEPGETGAVTRISKELDLARKELSDLRASFYSASEERDQAIRQSTQLQQSLTSVKQHLNELRSASKAVDKIEAENIGSTVLFPDSVSKSSKQGTRKRYKLMRKRDEVLATAPEPQEMQTSDDTQKVDPHQIVRRKLRERQ